MEQVEQERLLSNASSPAHCVCVCVCVCATQGYLPRDLYHLDSCYGSESDLRELISVCHEYNIKVIADIVVNHRCESEKREHTTDKKAKNLLCVRK